MYASNGSLTIDQELTMLAWWMGILGAICGIIILYFIAQFIARNIILFSGAVIALRVLRRGTISTDRPLRKDDERIEPRL